MLNSRHRKLFLSKTIRPPALMWDILKPRSIKKITFIIEKFNCIYLDVVDLHFSHLADTFVQSGLVTCLRHLMVNRKSKTSLLDKSALCCFDFIRTLSLFTNQLWSGDKTADS